jgi:hypothetical protein
MISLQFQMDQLHKSADEGAKQVEDCHVNPLYVYSGAQLPPASYHSVLKARRLPGFVLSPFSERYTTRTVNSFFDTQLGKQDPKKTRDSILRDVEAGANIAMRVGLDYVSDNNREFVRQFSFDRKFVSTRILFAIILHMLRPQLSLTASSLTQNGIARCLPTF